MININKLKETINFDSDGILLVDVSYLIYSRFFATRIWYGLNNKDDNKDQDWMKNKDFMDKFIKKFYSKIDLIIEKYNIAKENIIYALDSSFNDNWRYKLNQEYKLTRVESHKKNNFSTWDIFPYVENNLLTNKNTVKINGLEADDIIAILIKNIKKIDPTTNTTRKFKYFIFANDKDYVQICNDRTLLIDQNINLLSKKHLKDTTNIKYLIAKIMLGDKSDNIEPCYMKEKLYKNIIKSNKKELKCTPARVKILLENNNTYAILLDLLQNCRKYINTKNEKKCISIENQYFNDSQFIKNARLIDFRFIPKELIENINL